MTGKGDSDFTELGFVGTIGEGSPILGHHPPHGCQHFAQLLPLSLGVDVSTHLLLNELKCALVLGTL